MALYSWHTSLRVLLLAVWPLGSGSEAWPGRTDPPWSAEDALLLQTGGSPCDEVHAAVFRVIEGAGERSSIAMQQLVESIHWLLGQLEQLGEESDAGAVYGKLFGGPAATIQLSLDAVQLLGLTAMVNRRCFESSARLALGKSLQPLQEALQQQVSTLWWMFDIGQYSNTNSPAKHLQALLHAVRKSEAVFLDLAESLPEALARSDHFWGHQEHGMFVNTTVIYRTLFPQSAILDKGLLRTLLRLLPQDGSLADFGALDGQYSRWLNDTGWVTAFAFDGVDGVDTITGGAVSQVDLAEKFEVAWHPEPFDWVLCLEVAEHIPPAHEGNFLHNLGRHAAQGLVLSWAPPHIEGEGHVNCQELESSRQRIEALGFLQDEEATASLRAASEVPWIAESVAVYRRISGSR